MGEVIAVDFLKGRPMPPRPTRVRLFNDLTLELLRQIAEEQRGTARRLAVLATLAGTPAGRA